MNAYITDTDFLPDVLDIQYDEYQLLYGVVVNNREEQIYDSIICLCRRHRETPLRKAKIDYWVRRVSEVVERLVSHDKVFNEVYIPYIGLRCSIARLINLFSFAKDVLLNVRNLPMEELIRRDKRKVEDIADFYPIRYIDTLMRGAIPTLVATYGEEYKGVRIDTIIECELVKRGFGIYSNDISSIMSKNLYSELFFNEQSSAKVEKKNYSKEDEKAGRKEDVHLTRSIGLIYYVLQSLIKSAKNTTSKDKLQTLLNTTSATLSLCLFEPEREAKFEKSNWGGESKYQCVSKKKFLLNEENKKYIREVLTTYKCEIPDELKETK